MANPRVTSTTNLGPTNYQSRVQAGAKINDTIFAITFRQEPPYVVAYDPDRRQVTETYEIPTEMDVDSPGSWTLTAFDDRYLYTVLRDPTELLRFDRQTASFDRLERLPDSWCRALEAKGESIYFSTIREPRLYAYTHGTDELADLGRVHPTERYTHDLHVGEKRVYVGGGTNAHLTAVDRETGEHEDILPHELADESAVQSVKQAPNGNLVAATSPSMLLAVFSPDSSDDTVVVQPEMDYSGGAITALFVTEKGVYFTTTDPSYAIWYHPFGTDTVNKVAAPIGHPTRDIFTHNGELVGIGSGGYSAIWTLEPHTASTTRTVLGEVGHPRGPGNVQSLTAMDETVYAGGSRVTGIHHVGRNDFDIIPTPGEPKVMRGIDGQLYQAIYGGAGLVRYTPEEQETEELVWIGHNQNRPRGLHYHEPTGYLLIGTRPDYGFLGGAISAYDIVADELVSVDRNIIEGHSIQSIASIGSDVYVGTEIFGGGGTEPVAESARIVGWDPVDRQVTWSTTPIKEAVTIKGLTACDGRLYGQAKGRFFGLNPETKEVEIEREIQTGGDLQAHNGLVFGANADQLFVFDPETENLEVLVETPGGDEVWHNFPQLAIDQQDRIYVAKDKDLLQVEVAY